MNNIPVLQNEAKQLERLSAQRQLYSSAKRILGWQIILSAPFGILWAIYVATTPAAKVFAASWGIIISLIDLFWLNPTQKRLREQAAKIQELFDCDVLGLTWNDFRIGTKPDPELIKEQSDLYTKANANFDTLKNWYPVAVGQVSLDVGRIICQRTNCWWDSKQRRQYARHIISAVIFSTIASLAVGLLAHFTLEVFVLAVIAPLAPTLIIGTRQFLEQTETSSRLDRLKEHADRLWKAAFCKPVDCELHTKSRALQDEIFDNRKRSPLVFDWVFRKLHKNYEVQMNYGAEELVAEAKRQLDSR